MTKKASAKTTTLSKKGGARSFKKGSVDVDHLSDRLKGYVKAVGARNAFDFQEYNSMWQSCAPRAGALAANKPFVDALLSVSPLGSIVYNDIKAAATNVLLAMPLAKPGPGSINDEAGKIANCGIVIQCHLRKLSCNEDSEENLQKCLNELDDDEEVHEKLA